MTYTTTFFQNKQIFNYNFEAQSVSTDWSILLTKKIAQNSGYLNSFSEQIPDNRNPLFINYSLENFVTQRVLMMMQGYEDCNSRFREAIYNNLVKNNPDKDKLLLFKKTQKLFDRFLFIFFAKDRLLVPPNSISQIIEKWKDDMDFGDKKPLHSIFKQYFHVLNVGRPKSGIRQEIFAYNGGLFVPDEILDNISIDDEILHEHTLKLSLYDFETEVDVNILGHIFEDSLGEIENVQAEIAKSGDTQSKSGDAQTWR
jgi:hypothetical protein